MIERIACGDRHILRVMYTVLGETWVFRFRACDYQEARKRAGVFAHGKQFNFSWNDAAKVNRMITAAVQAVTHRRA